MNLMRATKRPDGIAEMLSSGSRVNNYDSSFWGVPGTMIVLLVPGTVIALRRLVPGTMIALRRLVPGTIDSSFLVDNHTGDSRVIVMFNFRDDHNDRNLPSTDLRVYRTRYVS